ncbi:MAG TPA: hypothetical protein VI704_03100 [Bacteroidota bacterium]|nr:hypothetical protein [Bacteroidota bacterium]
MKRIILFAILAVAPSFLFAGVFESASGQGRIIEWKTSDESQVQYFLVLRREWQSDHWGPSSQVGEKIAAKGFAFSYRLEDNVVFKNADRTLQYEIQAINSQNVVIEVKQYSTLFREAGLTSAARSTWGSIKAMFR